MKVFHWSSHHLPILEFLDRQPGTRAQIITQVWGSMKNAKRPYAILRQMTALGYMEPAGAQLNPANNQSVTQFVITDLGRAYLTVLRAALGAKS